MRFFLRLVMAISFSFVMTACNSGDSTSSEETLSSTPSGNTQEESSTNDPEQSIYGAEVYGFDSDKILYGKFTIRMKMVSKPGVISSFFLYDNDSWAGGIPWREIDIESIGKSTDLLQTNIITGTSDSQVHSDNVFIINDIESYHEYTLIWTPDEVTWLVDGVQIHQELATNSQQVRDLIGTPQTYRMNLWVAESVAWAGEFDMSSLPLQQEVDWVEYQEYDTSTQEFTFSWRDDFDSGYLDTNRWGVANWTFDDNASTFSTSNVSVEDGNLILRLTD